nr:PhzF family phenazine biosynthesis protein [uncultured Anaeromusa sp.]
MRYFHVDVFADKPLQGNGLAVVFPPKDGTEASSLLAIAQEFKQFETIFLYPQAPGKARARIFTVEEELVFAGHPVLGAAAVLHELHYPREAHAELELALPESVVALRSTRLPGAFRVEMEQGTTQFGRSLSTDEAKTAAAALRLQPSDLHAVYPLEVASNGLPYLLVPVRQGLEEARIVAPDFAELLDSWGAKFVYLFQPETLEGRTWDNRGLVEDVATGSAAGPLCSYLVRHGRCRKEERITISQGGQVGRPSRIYGWVAQDDTVTIQGEVVFFADGLLSVGVSQRLAIGAAGGEL